MLSIDEWKLWYLYTIKYYAAIRKKRSFLAGFRGQPGLSPDQPCAG